MFSSHKVHRVGFLVLLGLLAFAVVVGAAGKREGVATDWMEYSFAFYDDAAYKWANNPNDVVTPYVEQKFKIRVSEVSVAKDEDFTQRLNQWIAAGMIPDVICAGKADEAVMTGKFAVLDDYIAKMANYNKYFDQQYWPRYMNNGHKYQIPNVTLNLNSPEYQEDPWNPGDENWALWVREDILRLGGYKFTPLAELRKTTTDLGKKPTAADLAIDPPIDTPEALYTFLKKVKSLNLSVGDKAMIPLSIPSWSQFHLGSMFDFGHWRIDEKGEVDGYLGLPGAKPYYKFLNRLYREGLIDKDFIIQKDEQLQEKVATGRVAIGMYAPDLSAAVQSMRTINPDASVRYIPWPKETAGKGIFDIYQGGGWRYVISASFPDIGRLTQYFDWFYSDEGLETITWGPESANLWVMQDGRKVFRDKEVENAMLNAIHGQKGADFYGVYDWTAARNPFWSKAAMATPVMTHGNPKSFTRSYPPRLDILSVNKALSGYLGVDYKGIAASSDSRENSLATNNFFWTRFQGEEVAKVLIAQTDADFDKAWNEIYAEFVREGKYAQAKLDMKVWFDTYGPKTK